VKRPRTIFAIAIAASLATIIVLAWPRDKEPTYHGKNLSQWLRVYQRPEHKEDRVEAEQAVHQIGTNALPWLVKWIGNRPPKWSPSIGSLHASWNPANRIIHFLQKRPVRIAQARWDAFSGFDILGQSASNAVPQLVLMLDSDNPAKQWPVNRCPLPAYALAAIGKPGLKPLLEGISDPRAFERNQAGVTGTIQGLSSLPWSGRAANMVAAAFAKGLGSTNKTLRLASANALNRMDPIPPIAIPALRKCCR
jgi:hypothetical protein